MSRGWVVPIVLVVVGTFVGCQREVYEIDPTGTRVRVPERTESTGTPVRNRRRHRVVDVPSGDTIVLDDGRTIRYAGIEAPGPGERYFEESTRANRLMVLGRDVVLIRTLQGLESHEGAQWAFVLVEYTESELIRQGHARPPDGSAFLETSVSMLGSGAARVDPDPTVVQRIRLEYYLRLESKAKEKGIGIWE